MQHYFQSRNLMEQASRLPDWEQRYDQLSCGNVEGSLWLTELGGLRLFRETLNQSVVQRIRLPKDNFTVLLRLAWPKTKYIEETPDSELSLLPTQDDFYIVTPAGMDIICLSIPCNEFTHLLDEEVFSRCRSTLADKHLMFPSQLVFARQALLGLLDMAQRSHQTQDWQIIFKQRAINTVASLLEDLDRNNHYFPTLSTRQYIVRRSHELLMNDPTAVLMVSDLCQRLKVSRRTLQYSFQTVTGVTPIHYLRSIRLNAARRALLHSPEQKVGEIAAQWGFEHSSYFTRSYQKLFAEKPSHGRHGYPKLASSSPEGEAPTTGHLFPRDKRYVDPSAVRSKSIQLEAKSRIKPTTLSTR
ncbi:helix-turn-helix domain-containing protein [Pseudomonas sp. LTJR-52]|uniref:helix-turn-helix domain-containing protein n=1 Tax=Pseudomonas sp. LTJR-52 TaxID=2479392 RepID=UPI000EFBBB66|nr:helix-turn-helix domain-containing protein [Pseudomonas sp. LTJR-52]AYN96761.1 helix-turn-helix domain-containing protein [Pseudomonas sp. LTJR-52]